MVEIMQLRFTTLLLLKSMLAVTENFMIPRCLVMLEYKTCANKCRLMILACNCLDLIHFLFKKLQILGKTPCSNDARKMSVRVGANLYAVSCKKCEERFSVVLSDSAKIVIMVNIVQQLFTIR